MGVNVQEACFYALISTDSYYRKHNTDEVFRNRIESAKRFLYIASKKNISQKILAGSIGLSKWFLEKKDGEYRSMPTTEGTTNNNEVAVMKETPQETARRFLAKYGKRLLAQSRQSS